MAQATASSTDELLSQLAASEIDRLLSEADAKAEPAPAPAPPAPEPVLEKKETPTEPVAEGTERTALLEAAGFESKEAPAEPAAPPAAAAPPAEDERSALLQAAGFESPGGEETPADVQVATTDDDDRLPFYLKPLVWMNIPLENSPLLIRQMLGRAGIVTLVNALAVLTYVFFFKKH
jgi:hypothetical protein